MTASLGQDYQEAKEAKEDMDGRDFMGRPVRPHFVAADGAFQHTFVGS